MTAIGEIMELRKMVREKKIEYNREIARITSTDTIFNRHHIPKMLLLAKIQQLDEIEERLNKDLRKEILFEETEL